MPTSRAVKRGRRGGSHRTKSRSSAPPRPPLYGEPVLTGRAILAGFDRGLSSHDIAAELGVTRERVRAVCYRADRSFFARRLAATAAADQAVADALDAGESARSVARVRAIALQSVYRAAQRARDRAAVPAWVPRRLRPGFLAVARRDGEHAAAAWARRVRPGHPRSADT